MKMIRRSRVLLMALLANALMASESLGAEIRCSGSLRIKDATGRLLKSEGQVAIARAKSQKLEILTPKLKELMTVYPWWGIHQEFHSGPIPKDAIEFKVNRDQGFSVQYSNERLECEVDYE